MKLKEYCETALCCTVTDRLFFRFVFSLLFATTVLSSNNLMAQQFKFSSIEVEGNLRIESSTITNYAEVELSTFVTAAELNSA